MDSTHNAMQSTLPAPELTTNRTHRADSTSRGAAADTRPVNLPHPLLLVAVAVAEAGKLRERLAEIHGLLVLRRRRLILGGGQVDVRHVSEIGEQLLDLGRRLNLANEMRVVSKVRETCGAGRESRSVGRRGV